MRGASGAELSACADREAADAAEARLRAQIQGGET